MCCIEPAAKTNLNDRRGDLLLAERFEDGADEDLKLGGWSHALFDLVGGIEGTRDRLGEREWGEWLPIDLYPLPVADQMRLRRGGVANPRRAEGRRDEGNDAPLAVGSGDERTANSRLG